MFAVRFAHSNAFPKEHFVSALRKQRSCSLALPVILGAAILEAQNLFNTQPSPERILILVTGTIIAAIAGFVAIKLVLGILQKKKFSWFAYYCFLVGILGIFFVGQ